jgi:phage baseplate assembly protein W
MSESRETLKVDSVKDEIKQTLTRQWPRISILEINSAHPEIEGQPASHLTARKKF